MEGGGRRRRLGVWEYRKRERKEKKREMERVCLLRRAKRRRRWKDFEEEISLICEVVRGGKERSAGGEVEKKSQGSKIL